jgi:mannan endo-1,4-beta-mannosidase
MKKLIGIITLLIFSANTFSQLADTKATSETKALYTNLKLLSKHHILFGHQHAMEYGHGWNGNDSNRRSDVQSVTGSHPAVIGVDFMDVFGKYDSLVDKRKESLRKNIAATYNRGGITTISWHYSNPASAGDFYWKDSVSVAAVKLIIPGGSHHEKYKQVLKDIAAFASSVKGNDGKLVPMIFRPYHEFDGDWFWWGAAHCTADEFKTLWRFTVSYLRDTMNVHNFIYAFSPDNKFDSEADYLKRYPGDKFVDIVGVDNYGDWGRDGKYNLAAGIKKLQIIDAYARKANKLAAFTETGLESIPDNMVDTNFIEVN